MKINWKLRLKNKATLAALLAVIVGGVYSVCTILGVTPRIEQGTIEALIATVLTLLTALGIITDPTTAGIADSQQAMQYTAPKKADESNTTAEG